MGSAGGASLVIFGIIIAIGSLSGWFYLAYRCSSFLGSGLSQLSRYCLTFYSPIRINEQGLASSPPPILVGSFALGILIIICGTTMIAASYRKKE